ncbi:MAG: hypothetical protein R3C14_42615 [Caldilineaceae bacterium]
MQSQNQEPFVLASENALFHFNGVPVVVKPGFWPIPILLFGFLTWAAGRRRPQLSWRQRLGVALLAMPVTLVADVGHALAHTVSARMAGAPMDEILLYGGMPRTLYRNNTVPPKTHIQRALGGPVFSLVCSMLSLLWWRRTARGSTSHELAGASLVAHSYVLLGSLTPLPIVDGGVILKWKLVEAEQSPEQAEQIVRKTTIGLSVAVLGLGALFGLFGKRKLIGGLLAAGGAAGIAVGSGWLK